MVLQIKLYQLIEELMAGKTKVKSQILINDNDDSIAFEVNRRKKWATVTYYYTWNSTEEIIDCTLLEADERYEQALKNGYKIGF